MNEELEFTNEQLERIDEIDNTVYNALLILLEKDEESFPWDISIISEVVEAISDISEKRGYHLRRPCILRSKDGNDTYVE